MMTNSAVKEQLINEIERLPQNDLREVLDFVRYVRSKRDQPEPSPRGGKLDPRKDPVLKLMGTADVEPFADAIDEELYGRVGLYHRLRA